jgi:hypothetical protein
MAVALFTVVPIAVSQSATTITSYSSSTEQFTSTQLSYIPVSTTEVTSIQNQTIDYDTIPLGYDFNTGTFSLSKSEPMFYCEYNYFSFRGLKSQRITGEVKSSGPVGFALMSQQQLTAWKEAGSCPVTENDAIIATDTDKFTVYSLNYTVWEDGQYIFLFYNANPYPVTISFLPTAIGPATATSTLYTLSSMIKAYTTTKVVSIVTTSTSTSAQGFSPSWISPAIIVAAIVIIIIVIVVGAYIGFRSRSRKGQGPTVSKVSSMFCVSCGAELTPNAKFCKKCGTPVTAPQA